MKPLPASATPPEGGPAGPTAAAPSLFGKGLALVLARGFTTLFNSLSTILLARALGADQYGNLSLIVVYLTFFQLFAGFGIDPIFVREVAQDPARQNRLFGTALLLRLGLAGVTFLLAGGSLLLVPYPDEVKRLLFWCAFSLFFNFGTLFAALFQARLQVLVQARSDLLVAVLLFLANLVLILQGASLAWFAFTQTFLFLFQFLSYLFFLGQIPGFALDLRFDRVAARRLLIESLPLGLFGVFVFLNVRFDQFLVFSLLDPRQAGLYAAISRLTECLNIIPIATVAIVYPLLCTHFEASPGEFERLAAGSFRLLGAIIMPVAILCSFHSPLILGLVFGQKYLAAAGAFAVLIWSAVFAFCGSIMTAVLNAARQQRLNLLFAFSGAALSLFLNLLLIPRFGIEGSAAATVISASALGGLLYFLVPRARPYGIAYYSALGKPALAGFLMALSQAGLSAHSPWLAMPVGLLLYLTSLARLRPFPEGFPTSVPPADPGVDRAGD